MKPRQRFMAAVEGRSIDRLPFVPLAFGVCAKVQGVSHGAMLTNATVLANSIVAGQKFFRYDGVVTYLDSTLLTEALGVNGGAEVGVTRAGPAGSSSDSNAILQKGRFPVMLEGVRRIAAMVKREGVLVVSPVSGPAALSIARGVEIGSDGVAKQASDVFCALVSALCEAGADVVLLMEDRWPAPDAAEGLGGLLSTMRNITSHYEAKLLLMLSEYEPANVAALDVDGLIVPLGRWSQEQRAMAIGVGLEEDVFERDDALPANLLAQAASPTTDGVRFVSTMSDVPAERESINRLLTISGILGCHSQSMQ